MNPGCSDKIVVVAGSDCEPVLPNNLKKVRIANTETGVLAKSVVDGSTKIVTKTIFDIEHKTKQQITDILLNDEREFLKTNPDYQYDNYRYEDGKYGERTIMLIFKRK